MTTHMCITRRQMLLLLSMIVCATCLTMSAQVPPVPGMCNVPASQRAGDIGCYLSATETLGALPEDARFWHIYNYPTRPAAEAVKAPRGTVVEAFGKVWLYAIAASSWKPAGGQRIAVVGPLPIATGTNYTARYMEAVFPANMSTTVHVHSGAEAWYVVSGAQCLETPDGFKVLRAGESGLVPAGPPMRLSSVGADTRCAVLLVLHDTAQPWMTNTGDWKPKGLCPQ